MYCPLSFATATDVQFSQTLLGHSVPFATAGDCYSAARCPQVGIRIYLSPIYCKTASVLMVPVICQGQFSINLTGTGLKVAESTKWVSHGNYVAVKVHRSEVNKADFFHDNSMVTFLYLLDNIVQ